MAEKRSYVRAMFARIAPRYDLMNRLMTLGRDQVWRRRAAHLALGSNAPAPRFLDLATGTGDLARVLLQLKHHAQVVGLDLTFEMLLGARAKNLYSIQFINGDALELPFPNDTFDGITSAFMLRNVVDLARSFEEMVRVAKPNARIVALEITQPRLPVWRELYSFYFYRVVPILGGIISGDMQAYRYLPQSVSRFVSPQELATVMTHAGVRELQYQLLNLGTIAIHFGMK